MSSIISSDGVMEKLTILSDAAKFDVSCTSSGVDRKSDGKHMGSAAACGICHTFAADGRCISLLKILLTNECIYNCAYCVNRSSNDVKRVAFTPEEVCTLTMGFYRRNYIEGLFLSSGIVHSPDYTMGLLYEVLFLLRMKYHFHGYIHVKGIPGASAEVVEQVGYLADRMSVNLELPTAEGLRELAPNKVRTNILRPMRQIQNGIKESRYQHGISSMKSRMAIDEKLYYEQMAEISESKARLLEYQKSIAGISSQEITSVGKWGMSEIAKKTNGLSHANRYFVPAGQSTQMIIGATKETDYEIMSVTEALYNNFEMKRVFYSAFVNINKEEALPGMNGEVPLLREHRLYQADFLLRFYGFKAGELLSEKNPNFNPLLDPKCHWAIQHLELFPVEINRADYYTLLRVPGIGTKSAKRILMARKHAKLDFSDIKKMGVVLKRALYFITCQGRMLHSTKIEEDYITRHLVYQERPTEYLLSDGRQVGFEQLSLFDMGLQQGGQIVWNS